MKNASEIQPAASCFKVCTVCGRAWPDRQSFLSDPDITVGGYQVHFKELELGFFLFNHETCRNTLAAPVADFRDLYDGGRRMPGLLPARERIAPLPGRLRMRVRPRDPRPAHALEEDAERSSRP
jgi:hypothetical protein